jgi:hypothetical protein
MRFYTMLEAAMATPYVTIDSGPPEASCLLREVPQERWQELLLARRRFLAVRISYDCRELVHFIKDAHEMWEPLGYANVDDLIQNGLELEPEEIRIAVRWLELNEPESAIGLPEVQTRAQKAQAAALANPEPVRQTAGNPTGANQHTPRNPDKEENHKDSSQYGTSSAYRVRKLRRDHPEVADRLDAGEFPSVAAAERAAQGEEPNPPRKAASPAQAAQRCFAKLTPAEKVEFLRTAFQALGRADQQEFLRWASDLQTVAPCHAHA